MTKYFCLAVLFVRVCCLHVSGISFLPYPGAAYAAQVLDGSAVPAQTLIPGVTYSAVTTDVQSQLQYAQPVTSSYRAAEHSLGDKNPAAANTLPVLSAVNAFSNGQTTPVKQPLQSINLSDLDYSFLMEHGMAEAAGTMDLRNPAVLANMLQSLNAASMPSDERSTQASQPADIRQFPVAKQLPMQAQQPFQEAVNISQQHVPLSNQQVNQLYASYGTAASTAAVLQSSQQKDAVQGGGVVWPWGDQLLLADKSQNEAAVGVVQTPSVVTPVSSSALPVSYEAVSPPATVDNMSYSLLDNLQLTGDTAGGYQLSSFLGSTVDSSTLFAAVPYCLASSLQQTRTDTWTVAASYSAGANARLQPGLALNEQSSSIGIPMPTLETTASRQSAVELDKGQKQKSNLGVVLPMTHNSRDERNSITSEASSSSCRTTSVSASAAAEPLSQYPSAEKSAGPVADTASGGIVLTNITGNVYVNQYTMMPGGTQPLDNALLHADLAVGGGSSSLSYDNMVDETGYSLAAPSVAVVLNANDDELSRFAAEPPVSSAEQPGNLPHSAQPTPRKSAVPESSFFGADAAPVLAAKPSNKFESCFLQFICGHKAETLSSVLNSPIKTRPVLPKYIPEPRRPKVVEVIVEDNEEKTEVSGEQSSETADADDRTTESAAESAPVSNVCCLTVFYADVDSRWQRHFVLWSTVCLSVVHPSIHCPVPSVL